MVDLGRTAAALEVYDAFMDQVYKVVPPNQLELAHDELTDLEMRIAEAFWQDTQDRNDRITCLRSIQPGPKNPPEGSELSYVRRMVKQWRESKCQTIQN